VYNNKMYGAMQFGGPDNGVIFEWDPATNIYVIKYSLQSGGPGNFTGPFTVAGNVLYATPNQGPDQFGNGCIVEFNPATNALTVKQSFVAATGAGSYGGLTLYNGKYYGTNTTGGADSRGAYFEWDPASNIISNRKYATAATGEQPASTPVFVNGKLYATTYTSSMVEWDVAANTLTKAFTFGESKGQRIETRVIYYNGKVYGVTSLGGNNNKGVLFSKDVNTGVYSILHHFNKTGFSFPTHSQLHINNGIIYGATDASVSASGVIYQYNINTGTYTERYNLTTAGGFNIKGTWILANNKYYGIATSGGASFGGTVFSWDPVTNVFTNLSNLSGYAMGGGFTEVGGFLYTPITISSNGNPAVFRFNPANNTFTLVATSNSNLGSGYGGEEFTLLNGKLYTGYPAGTNNGYGSIAEFDPATNNFVNKRSFSSAYPPGAANTGAASNGILLAHNGELFGLTNAGGLNGSGTTFKYNPVTNVFTKLEDVIPVGSSISYGNGFTIVQRTGVLPIQLNYFTVVKENKTQAKLSWQTAMEQNNKGFALQRSGNGIDFENIGWRPGTNTDRTAAYSFIDVQPLPGLNYYRFQQSDLDGRTSFSPVKQLDFGNRKAFISTYPNPVQDLLAIRNNFSQATFYIVDGKGATVMQQLIGKGTTNLNLTALSKGVYYYKAVFEDGSSQAGSFNKN
ncbi:MAG: T9SS type A sorting domain-containing protein, partial [Sphingobacteriales bacterium]